MKLPNIELNTFQGFSVGPNCSQEQRTKGEGYSSAPVHVIPS